VEAQQVQDEPQRYQGERCDHNRRRQHIIRAQAGVYAANCAWVEWGLGAAAAEKTHAATGGLTSLRQGAGCGAVQHKYVHAKPHLHPQHDGCRRKQRNEGAAGR